MPFSMLIVGSNPTPGKTYRPKQTTKPQPCQARPHVHGRTAWQIL